MKRIAALAAAAAVMSTLAAITRATAQQLPPPPVCATWENDNWPRFALATAAKNFRRFPQRTGKIAWRVKTFALRLAGSSEIKPGKRQADNSGQVGPALGICAHDRTSWLYGRGMNEAFFAELSAWLTQAGLAGRSETDIVSAFCDRFVAADFRLRAVSCLLTRCIPFTRAACFAGAMVPPSPRCSNMAAPTRTRSLRRAPTPDDVEMAERWRRPRSTGWSKPATRFCAAA